MRRSGGHQLALIAPYPPPRGGVSIHVFRLTRLLDAAGIDYVVYDTTRATRSGHTHPRVRKLGRWRVGRLFWYAIRCPDRSVYLCSGRLSLWILGALLARRRFVAVRLQTTELVPAARGSRLRRHLVRTLLTRFDRVICVNPLLMEAVEGLGVPAPRLRLFPGYLPPSPEELEADSVHPSVWRFLEGRQPVIAASGAFLLDKGRDVYGFDHLVQLANQLSGRYSRLAIVVCLWRVEGPKEMHALDELQHTLRRDGLEKYIYFNPNPGGFLPLIAAADVLVRPTAIEGDANTVREALEVGVPVVASDVTPRPDGCELFPYGDQNAFVAKVVATLDSREARSVSRQDGSCEHLAPDRTWFHPGSVAERYIGEIQSWISERPW